MSTLGACLSYPLNLQAEMLRKSQIEPDGDGYVSFEGHGGEKKSHYFLVFLFVTAPFFAFVSHVHSFWIVVQGRASTARS